MSNVTLSGWSAWAPGMKNRSDWRRPRREEEYIDALTGPASPDVEWVPSRRRRRCSKLTRIALNVAFNCCNTSGVDPADVKSVFSTRHGELTLTVDLLNTLADDELLSPMTFANSVHNTPSSYFCICADNHHPSRTVSAGLESFQNGFLDAAGLLDIPPDLPVLLVDVHVTPPEPLDQFDPLRNASYGVALLLSGKSGSGPTLAYSLNHDTSTDTRTLPPSVSFLHWFLHEESRHLHLPGAEETVSWHWERRDS